MIQTESRKEKNTCFNDHSQYSQSKITGLNMMGSLKRSAMCESKTSLHAVEYK